MRKMYIAATFCTIIILLVTVLTIDSRALTVVVAYKNEAVVLPAKPSRKSPAEVCIYEKSVPRVSDKDIELIALVVMAEAEGEPDLGKILVIDTILNRMHSKHFPNTIYDVLYQRRQFTCMTNGRVERCTVDANIVKLIGYELDDIYDKEVIFFTAGEYSAYGVPMYQVGNHYFSKYA